MNSKIFFVAALSLIPALTFAAESSRKPAAKHNA